MNCPSHPRSEVIGYCDVCGAFGCGECLTRLDGHLYCPRHYRQAQHRVEELKRSEDARKRHQRQKLVVHYVDGRLAYGYCLALNPKDTGFHLEQVDRSTGAAMGQTTPIDFRDLKAVFFVKSFDGNYNKSEKFREWNPEGSELIAEFKDSEVVRGTTLHKYDRRDPRFYLIPSEGENNISVLIEAGALANVYTPEEYRQKQEQERAQRKEAAGGTDLSQEETLGDFYFDTRNYPAALEQYGVAQKKSPQSGRLRRKILATEYNIGVQCIKSRDFSGALNWMMKILKVDPENAHAKKKVVQLRRILDRGPKAETTDSLE